MIVRVRGNCTGLAPGCIEERRKAISDEIPSGLDEIVRGTATKFEEKEYAPVLREFIAHNLGDH